VRGLPAGSNTRIENRMGSSDANPYLLTAVMIAAGLDGIRRELDPGEPAQENLFENIRFPRLPSSPAQGVDALLADDVLVAALGADFTQTFADVLRFDWQRFLSHVTDWEINEYREML
jgi:glutamine synthetase